MSPVPNASSPTDTQEALVQLHDGAYPPGIYRFVSRARPDPILAMVTDWGWYTGYIDGEFVTGKASFLEAAGQALAFPPYYGRNWDAFEEMVNDLSWAAAAGYLLLYDDVYRFAAAQPHEWQTALSILQRASAEWQRQGVPFYLLLRQNWRWNRHLPKLAA